MASSPDYPWLREYLTGALSLLLFFSFFNAHSYVMLLLSSRVTMSDYRGAVILDTFVRPT